MCSAYTALAHIVVTNCRHETSSHGDPARERGQQGAGSQLTGACRARVKIGKRLSIACAFLCSTASAELLASTASPSPAKTSFAYSISHTGQAAAGFGDREDHRAARRIRSTPTISSSPRRVAEAGRRPRRRRRAVRRATCVCSAVASVAQANNLPVPFFANLIWQESSFDTRTISRAGAQGIAQFMPRDRGAVRADQSVRADPRAERRRQVRARAQRAVRQSRPRGRGLQRRPAPRQRLAGQARRAAGRDAQLRDSRHRPPGRGVGRRRRTTSRCC